MALDFVVFPGRHMRHLPQDLASALPVGEFRLLPEEFDGPARVPPSRFGTSACDGRRPSIGQMAYTVFVRARAVTRS